MFVNRPGDDTGLPPNAADPPCTKHYNSARWPWIWRCYMDFSMCQAHLLPPAQPRWRGTRGWIDLASALVPRGWEDDHDGGRERVGLRCWRSKRDRATVGHHPFLHMKINLWWNKRISDDYVQRLLLCKYQLTQFLNACNGTIVQYRVTVGIVYPLLTR